MALPVSFGRPWVHEDWRCDGCDACPVQGHLYMSDRRPEYGLCSKCQREKQEEDLVYKIGRGKETRPFQIHCIDCDKCGVSPIEGPRYQHKVKQNFNLCSDCFSETTSSDAEEKNVFDRVDYTPVKSMCKTHQPVFHFHTSCDECSVDPICGPVYKSVEDPDYDLCLTCFDSELTKKEIDAHDFKRILRPKASKAVQVLIYSCSHCNATPICGPAYISQKNPEKSLCLLCFLNTTPAKQSVYQRREPPLKYDEKTMDPDYKSGAQAEEEEGEKNDTEQEDEGERGEKKHTKKKKKKKTSAQSDAVNLIQLQNQLNLQHMILGQQQLRNHVAHLNLLRPSPLASMW